MGGESDGGRVRAQLVETHWPGLVEQHTEHALANGQLTDLGHRRVVHARVQKRHQRALCAQHAQGAIAGAGQLHGCRHDAAQRRVQVEIGGEPDGELQQSVHLIAGT